MQFVQNVNIISRYMHFLGIFLENITCKHKNFVGNCQCDSGATGSTCPISGDDRPKNSNFRF